MTDNPVTPGNMPITGLGATDSNFGGTSLANQGCPYCGAFAHTGLCPRIERITYYENGAVKDVYVRHPWLGVESVQPTDSGEAS